MCCVAAIRAIDAKNPSYNELLKNVINFLKRIYDFLIRMLSYNFVQHFLHFIPLFNRFITVYENELVLLITLL